MENIIKFIKFLYLYDERLAGRTYPTELPLRLRWEAFAGLISSPLVARAYIQQSSTGVSLAKLIWMLMTTGPMKATDPRDKIFGLLGIANDGDEMELIADYTKSTRCVYEDVTWQFLRNLGPN